MEKATGSVPFMTVQNMRHVNIIQYSDAFRAHTASSLLVNSLKTGHSSVDTHFKSVTGHHAMNRFGTLFLILHQLKNEMDIQRECLKEDPG